MVSIATIRKQALSFPEATEETHFGKTSFRVKKKIFATYDDKNKRACIKLSEIDQDVFSSMDKSIIYPVNNKWGRQGWTLIELKNVHKDIFADALATAYCEVAPKKLSDLIRPGNSNRKTTAQNPARKVIRQIDHPNKSGN